MRILWLFLIFLFSLLSQAHAGLECPAKVYVDKPDCAHLCKAVYEKIMDNTHIKNRYTLVSAYQQPSFLPNVYSFCACTFGKYNVILGEHTELDSCYYTLRTTVPGTSIQKATGDFSFPMPLSDYLLRLFLFDKQVASQPIPPIIAVSPSGEMIKGMYTLYAKSIKAVSTYIAALLLTIAVSWQFISLISGNFTQVVRSPGQFFSNLVAGEKIANYGALTLATLFLVLPLNGKYTGLALQNDAVLKEVRAKCEMIKKEMQEEYDECVDEKQDLANLYGCDSSVWGNILSLVDQVLSGGNLNWNSLIDAITGGITAPWTCEALQEKECKDMRDALEKQYDKCVAEYEKYRESIPANLTSVEAPLAVRMIRDSILWGSNFAEKTVLPIAGGVIKNYIINRYVNLTALSEMTSAAGVSSVKQYKEAVDKMWHTPVFRTYGQESILCEGIVDGRPVKVETCADYYALTEEQWEQLLQQNPYECKDARITLGVFCGKLQRQKQIVMDVENSVKSSKDAIKWLDSSLTKAQEDFGWLSPAVMPLYSLYYEAARFGIKLPDKMAYGTLIASRHYLSSAVNLPAELLDNYAYQKYESVATTLDYAKKALSIAKGAVVGAVDWISNKAETALGLKEDYGDDYAGEMTPSITYSLGRMMVLYSIPPGDKFAQVITRITGMAEKVVLGLAILKTPYFVPVIAITSPIFRTILAIYAAAKLNEMFLAMLPLIVGSFALLIRAIQYFLEVILFVLITPFYAVAAVTKQKGKVMDFFITLFKLTFFPVVFLIASVMTFTAVELGFLFTYTVPVKYVLGIIPLDGLFTGFIAGIIDAVFIIFSSLVCASLAWFTGFNTTETIVDWISNIISYTDRKIQGFEQIAKHHVGKMAAKTAI